MKHVLTILKELFGECWRVPATETLLHPEEFVYRPCVRNLEKLHKLKDNVRDEVVIACTDLVNRDIVASVSNVKHTDFPSCHSPYLISHQHDQRAHHNYDERPQQPSRQCTSSNIADSRLWQRDIPLPVGRLANTSLPHTKSSITSSCLGRSSQ